VVWIVIGWLAAVLAILVLAGCKCLVMSDRLLITIVSASVVKVLGLLMVVVRHLFPQSK